MTRWLLTLGLALALASCSAASGSGTSAGDPELQKQLKALKTENAKLSSQVAAVSGQAFDRASKAEKKRNLKGSSRVLRSDSGTLRLDSLVIGPLKFKKKTGTFYLNVGNGTPRGGLADHKSNLSTKLGAATPAGEKRKSNTVRKDKKDKTQRKDRKNQKNRKNKKNKKNRKVIIKKTGGE